MVTSTDQPTDRQGEYRAICLFRKLENRKKAEICNSAFLTQETLFLTQDALFLAKDFQKVRKLRQILTSQQNSIRLKIFARIGKGPSCIRTTSATL